MGNYSSSTDQAQQGSPRSSGGNNSSNHQTSSGGGGNNRNNAYGNNGSSNQGGNGNGNATQQLSAQQAVGKSAVSVTAHGGKFAPTFKGGQIFASPSDQFLMQQMSPSSSAVNVQPEDYVSCVFKWEGKGGEKNVFITGSFNNWGKPIQMHKSGNDFSYVQNVKRGKHAYRFVVDDQMRHSTEQECLEDDNRQVINVLDVTHFEPYTGDENFFDKSKEQKIPESDFHQQVPDIDDYTKEPPSLPPHLRHIILNKASPDIDQMSLPAPQHVSLNHLYCTAIKDGMMVLGSTHRYKEKYCTVVFYAMMPPSSL
jgi:5'-AMP-activated protein kinase regulatory beta subunit